MGGSPLFTLVPQMAGHPLGNLMKAQKSASGVHQSRQSNLYSLRYSCHPEIQHRGSYNTNWAANLCRTIGLMKTKKLSLKKKLSQLNAMILARSFVNKCLDRVVQKDPEVLMELNKSWTPHIAVHSFHSSDHESVGIACIPYFCFAISGFMYMDMLIYYFKYLCLCKQNFQLIKHG